MLTPFEQLLPDALTLLARIGDADVDPARATTRVVGSRYRISRARVAIACCNVVCGRRPGRLAAGVTPAVRKCLRSQLCNRACSGTMRAAMSEQASLDERGQSSALSLALSIALGAALGSSVYVIAEVRHQKQLAEHAAHAAPPPAAEPPAASKPEPKPELAKAAEPEKKADAEEAEAAPPDPKAQALAARTAAEQALLDEARTQLEASNGTGALSTLDRMKKRFPRGALVQERELLRVEVYKAKGQTLAAKRAARKFAKSYPDNPHLGEIESLLN